MSLLLGVFVLQLFLHVLNTVGASTLNELLWMLYNKSPFSSHSKSFAQATQLRREVVRLQRELNATSAQDEFSKWAKLRRQHDKAAAEHDKATSSLQSSKSSFNTTCSTIRFLLTTFLRLFPQYYYSRSPLFWVPAGWAPWYVEWLLSFPRAPRGSISIQVWGIACAAVIKMVAEASWAVWILVQQSRVEKAKAKGREDGKTEMKVGADTKKEL
ncbi:hypothetical protein NA57DRAFT_74074 [Rhizodiscina lignyota]|uniref:Guided entry of tail-anchored proteins 1 n=1 Tax=Rhizodiscina lignyota TaxID=1504668 RepID=A0A9P4M7X4_9PEZI|nr:hypothetical protein NA57DRAFT_74074 [Rhizodiscina lignyota]